jgi:hypothetical protein
MRRVNRAPDPDQAFVIQTTAAYRPLHLVAGLGLASGTLGREIRLKRLRATKRSGKLFILGKWVLDWLERGGPEAT